MMRRGEIYWVDLDPTVDNLNPKTLYQQLEF
jgi:mRNA-degrading endonuclease toxin of MazEF toxin-antitoxin module